MYSVHYINFDELVLTCDFCGKEKQIKAVRSPNRETIMLSETGAGFVQQAEKCCSECLLSSGFSRDQTCYKDCKQCIRKLFPSYLREEVCLLSTYDSSSESYSSVSFDKGIGVTISRGGAPPIDYKRDCILS